MKLSNTFFILCLYMCFASAATCESEDKFSLELILFQQDNPDHNPSHNKFSTTDIPSNLPHIYSYSSKDRVYLSDKVTNYLNQKTISNGCPATDETLTSIITKRYPKLIEEYNNWQGSEVIEALQNNQKGLTDIKNKLEINPDTKVLIHLAIPLNTISDNPTQQVYIDSSTLGFDDFFGNGRETVKGYISLKINKNIDVKSQLIVKDGASTNTFDANRRMKKNQLNYIDDNEFGLLLAVNQNNQTLSK
ncbi:MAG: CsiV family protein [Pseudomonadota bacterium]|nr:CsiV family protein [Pseudomonadota bacterium]